MKPKQKITYIKNGVEKNVILSPFNRRKTLKQIYTEYVSGNDSCYEIKKDIEFVHFENIYFQNIRRITNPKDTTCILENCTFEKIGWYSYDITFEEGSIELIEPQFLGKKISITLLELEHFNFISTKKTKKDCKIQLKTLVPIKEMLTITDNGHIKNLEVQAKTISINNELKVEKLKLDADNIFIGNQNTQTTIDFKLLSFSSKVSANKALHLTNCTMNNIERSISTRFESPKIFIKNVNLNGLQGATLYINEDEYIKGLGQPLFKVTDNTIATTNLISVLKGYKQKIIKEHIEPLTQKYLIESDNRTIAKQKNLKEQLTKIKEQQKELQSQETELKTEIKKLQTNLVRKDKAIGNLLYKRPIKQLVLKKGNN